MAPIDLHTNPVRSIFRRQNGDASHDPTSNSSPNFGDWRNTNTEGFIVEGWGEGCMFGALLIMSVITIANMRRGVLLHKLILLELLLAMSHGTFCFMGFKGYGWYLSSTATLLYCSYFTHNIVAWLKIRPFYKPGQGSFPPLVCIWVRRIYLTTLAMTIPVLIFEIFNNFRYFNNISKLYEKVRPYEPLMRDPWWVFSCMTFFHVIRKCYSLNVFRLVKKSPRFGILLAAICLAISFTVMDIMASVIPGLSLTDGINPYWKLALVFKCLTDNIMLDDFKAVLQRLGALKLDGDMHAMQSNNLNMIPNEKAGIRDDDDEHFEDIEASPTDRTANREPRMSLSGRLLDDGETLDDRGRARRKQSMSASGVGRFGLKIKRLGNFASLRSSAEKEAKQNMERNKKIGSMEQHVGTDSDLGRAPTESQSKDSFDFITSALDTSGSSNGSPRA
ncbi:hypothetical protein NA57DRAFT_75990 [Rhizodiscina lignyota]|uniref:Uncharacterized protein n=1 Tax=Rhizodiscina lignyota TaxID=1504668 RepID=A0A9P4IFL3_9PEZI|nr:hypothetical protein NA57DRAFT_75990 [Rhizodiscina lignyota]